MASIKIFFFSPFRDGKMACQQTRVTFGHFKKPSSKSFSQIWMKIELKKSKLM
jgi:hypothetical protein